MRITIFSILGAVFLFVFAISIPYSSAAQVAVGIMVNIAPPELPVYDQPPCPGDDYIWTPGYWGWDDVDDDYYWIPGTWVLAPEPGFFWTPGYWAWQDTGFAFIPGYWGPVVGFYGGVDYGFGYFGHGFEGGRWDHGHFFYNRAVTNVNVTVIHNTYNTVVNHVTVNRVSYNGGRGGIEARPTAQEQAAAHDRHIAAVAAQNEHVQLARQDRELRASVNHGRPPVAATEKPGSFKGNGVVAAREGGAVHTANEHPENNARPENNGRPESNAGHTNTAVHPRDLPPAEHQPAPNTGNAKLDQKYLNQQNKLAAQQEKERQKLQARQDKEDQRVAKQQNNEAKKQQTEQRHQQQTQQMVERHQQQTQHMQARQAPRPQAPAPHAEAPPAAPGGRPR
jgi:WXXGXW repeat (2 copies)